MGTDVGMLVAKNSGCRAEILITARYSMALIRSRP
jgi:hypothetical protein